MDHLPGTTVKPAMRVDIYSHFFKISNFKDDLKHVLLQYCRGLGHYGLKVIQPGRFVRAIKCVYAATTIDRREFRFHINLMDDVLRYVSSRGYYSSTFLTIEHHLYEPVSCEYDIDPEFKLWLGQASMIDYLAAPGKTKVLVLQTGKGKTLIAHSAIARIGQRVALVIKGMFVEDWMKRTFETLRIGRDELMVVRGAKDLKAVILLAKTGQLHAKFIIITIRTMYNYIEAYEQALSPEMFDYPCMPDVFWETLGVGVRLIDEVHMEFHMNFCLDMYTHIPKTISATATLDSDDSFINRMYNVAFPPECRPDAVEHDKYVNVTALAYKLTDFRRVRFIGANRMYSHIRFEQSILKYADLTRKYFTMILDVVRDEFIKVFVKGQRMLLFCSTVEMCTGLRDYMRVRYPMVRIGRFVQGDSFSVLSENDIIISTLKSAGTARDIDGLRLVLMTDNVSSKVANIQATGRLRRLKDWPDLHPRFVYFYAMNVPKHIEYHEEKIEKLRDKVLSHSTLISPYHI